MSGGYGSQSHLVALPGTEWMLWRQAVLRTTGFPAEDLDRLCPADCATAADAYLDGQVGPEQFDKRYNEATAHCANEVYRIAGDPLFREAVTWQSRSVLPALTGIRSSGPEPRRTGKHRERERIVARYWQRYCAKTETIGFFGPVCWIDIDPTGPAVVARPGPGLVRSRAVLLEDWALTAYADEISADPRVRGFLPPALPAHLTLDGSRLLDPNRAPVALSRAEAAVLRRCDGRRSAMVIAGEEVADGSAGLRTEQDVYVLLAKMVARGMLRWNIDLPVSLHCEQVLRESLDTISDSALHDQVVAGLDRLSRARDTVAGAAGDPDALASALSTLETEFTAVTGREPGRRAGQMYAGRSLCWEETTRDLDITIGGPVLEALAAPMSVALRAARWVSAELAEAYLQALRGIYDDLSTELGTGEVPLGQLWYLAQGLFYGTGERPADAVAAEFSRRWAELFGLSSAGTADVTLTCAELAPHLDRLFPSRPPGWSDARLHSPDLQLCADNVAALNRGQFTAVLGELHVAWATNSCGVFIAGHPDRRALRDAHVADVGAGRLRPLLPAGWPRYSSRLAFALTDPSDVLLGFAPAPGADPDRTLPISAVSISPSRGRLIATALDGRSWPLVEVFTRQLSEVAVDAFKLAGTGGYTPRVTLDRMVITRRTWRTTVGACALATVLGDRERYLAGRRWRRELGLPERVFAKIGTETKPTFLDLSSPLYVDTFASMVRSARMAHGNGVAVSVTEMLPDTDQAWVPDSAGRRYVSELRLQIRDPLPPSTHTPADPR